MVDDTPIYRDMVDRIERDPRAPFPDDHDVQPIDPGWFLNLDDVDSRLIRDSGAPT